MYIILINILCTIFASQGLRSLASEDVYVHIYINILIIIIFYLKKVGSRCFDPQFQKWVAMWAGVHFITSKDSKRTIFFIVRTSYIHVSKNISQPLVV